jgi:EAL domain-containing protein (putative c-di-GMP-specific phosphodiesterase class I)/ActR/RegA family two-component response regulator
MTKVHPAGGQTLLLQTSPSDKARVVTVLIAEDDGQLRGVLSALIDSEPALQLVGAASDADEAIELARETRPDVAIVDVRMPGGGGIKVARELRRSTPDTKVLALTAAADRNTVLQMLEAGVVGYLVKGSSAQHILESIERAGSGQSMLSAEVTGDVISELVGQLGNQRRGAEKERRRRGRIERAIADETAVQIVFQPICALDTLEPEGFEALARFPGPPQRGPEHWFREASDVGLSIQLELVAVERALTHLAEIPDGAFMSINVSPATVVSAPFKRVLGKVAAERIVVEITEHAPIANYDTFNAGLAGVRALGARLAIDDAGAGFASLRHILRLEPELIKLDITLIAAIESDRSQQALAAGLISFADRIGATVIAEGIEHSEALDALRELGVPYGQGFHLGRPAGLKR